MVLRIILLMSVVFCSLRADNIYLKDGTVIRNVKIIGEVERYGKPGIAVLYYTKNAPVESFVTKESLLRVELVPVPDGAASSREKLSPDTLAAMQNKDAADVPAFKSFADSLDDVRLRDNILYNVPTKQYKNIQWITVAAFFILTGWDYTAEASDLQKIIDANNKTAKMFNSDADNSPYETAKTRKSLLGIVSFALGVGTAIYALTPIEIQTDGRSISMRVPL